MSGGRRAERPWSHGDMVVLTALVRSGERLAGLAARLRRPRTAITAKCRLEKLDIAGESAAETLPV